MAQVLVAIPDLFFRSKVLEAGKALQVELEVARDADQALQSLRAEKPKLILLDLEAAPLHPLELLRSVQDVPVVGFLAHERAELREQALAAGCTEVLTKGQFSARLPDLLRRVQS
jgi:CheY-like chemotaxis protein